MKQRITVEQLNELTDEQKKKLWEWWDPESGDMYYYPAINNSGVIATSHIESMNNIKKSTLPLLNIGQLIEHLTQTEKPLIEAGLAGWRVWHQGEHYSKVDLCDALWEAVKGLAKGQ